MRNDCTMQPHHYVIQRILKDTKQACIKGELTQQTRPEDERTRKTLKQTAIGHQGFNTEVPTHQEWFLEVTDL